MSRPQRKSYSLTAEEFTRKYEEYEHRLKRLREMKDGVIPLVRVKVRSYAVGAYTVGTHWRVIGLGRRQRVATK